MPIGCERGMNFLSQSKRNLLERLFENLTLPSIRDEGYAKIIERAKQRIWITSQNIYNVKISDKEDVHMKSVPKIVNMIENHRDFVLNEFRIRAEYEFTRRTSKTTCSQYDVVLK